MTPYGPLGLHAYACRRLGSPVPQQHCNALEEQRLRVQNYTPYELFAKQQARIAELEAQLAAAQAEIKKLQWALAQQGGLVDASEI